jgi:hypothetical protein
MCGVKRKYDEVEGGGGNSQACPAPDERQSILNISMCKLRTSPTRRVEPSLRRSVLIFNTLRHIEVKLRQEGVKLNPAAKSELWQQSDNSLDTLDSPPGAELPTNGNPPCPGLTSGAEHAADFHQIYSCRDNVMEIGCHGNTNNMADLSSQNMDTSDGSPTSDSYNSKLTTTAADLLLNSEKLTISSFASLLDLDRNNVTSPPPSSHAFATVTSSNHDHMYTSSQVYTSSAVTSLTSSLASASLSFTTLTPALFTSSQLPSHDIFGDIDLSMYDFDLLSASFPPSMKLSPLSAEELMHSFPVEPLGTLGSKASSTPCFKNELLAGDDFDHIMQVLVGI